MNELIDYENSWKLIKKFHQQFNQLAAKIWPKSTKFEPKINQNSSDFVQKFNQIQPTGQNPPNFNQNSTKIHLKIPQILSNNLTNYPPKIHQILTTNSPKSNQLAAKIRPKFNQNSPKTHQNPIIWQPKFDRNSFN